MYQYGEYINSFKEYAVSFYCEDSFINENIDLKIDHTMRVCKVMCELSKSINLNEKDRFLAFLISLYHDFGRFKQMATYRTFSDRRSEDHGDLSAKELKKSKFIDFLNEEDQNLIINSILNHNKFKIDSDNLSQRKILFCKLIRDADKLDIFKVITDYYLVRHEHPNEAIELHSKEEGEISEDIIENIFNKKLTDNYKVNNAFDMRVLRIGWVFDLNFSYSFKFFKKENYLEKSIEALPKTEIVRKIYDFVNNYVNEKIQTA